MIVNPEGQRAYVSGASGFVGRWLCAHLAESGDIVIEGSAEITDAQAIADEIASARPGAIYHLAGQADVGQSWNDPRATFAVNAVGTLNVLEAARALDRRPRVLTVGTAEVYGKVEPSDIPIREASALRPTSPYGASKAAAEQLAVQAALGGGLAVIRVRPFNHVGPGQSDKFVVSAVARQVAEAEAAGHDTVSVGNLAARRDFTDVRDIVRAYRLILQHGEPGEVYNVGTGVDLAIDDVVRSLVELATRKLRIVVDPDRFRPIEIPVLRADISKLVAATGWSPRHDIRETVHDVLQWWRDGAPPVPPDR